jgi:LPS sulfotransferase NodH
MAPVRFVLLSTQRSGSTWVIDMLNSHSRIAAYSELLLENARGTPEWGGAKDMPFFESFLDGYAKNNHKELDNALFQYLDTVFEPRMSFEAIGFKLMYTQAGAYPDVVKYITQHGVHLCHLIRNNHLDKLISKKLAVTRGVFHARSGEQLNVARIRLNTATLLSELDREEKDVNVARQRYARLGLPYIEVYYEELKRTLPGFGQLIAFLGLDPIAHSLHSTLRIVNESDHVDVIENYDSVKGILRGTRYYELLR